MKILYYVLILVWFGVCLVAGMTGNEFLGLKMYTVNSGSMEPAIKNGSVVVVARQRNYKKGEIISFYAKTEEGPKIITHRVERLGGNVYLTKGDANSAVDEAVEPRLVIGKVMFVIPLIGNLIEEMRTRVVIKIVMILPAGLVIINEGLKIWRLTRK
jgi:signal peptidase